MVNEPWRFCLLAFKIAWDREFASVIQDALPSHVEMLSIFESPNSELVSAMHRDPPLGQIIDDNMTAGAELVRALVLRSCDLKHLSISFMIDARQFLGLFAFKSLLPQITIAHTHGVDPQERIPNKRGEACAVIYQRDRSNRRATLTRRGTWHFELNYEVIESWKKVDPDFILGIENEQLQAVKQNGDAIYHLRLPGEVIDPSSARQLRQEAFVGEEKRSDERVFMLAPHSFPIEGSGPQKM
ncbi:uncharacterized protein BBA_00480 [Beauveria bassiana ARSEF 2860]|uniref:DUF6546 domain-containing protein n=1 Tax=Beauveria bassiana (strain ARSEF 2860) TaxID=655819 RepID=J4WMD4_BEAB2|nr:uncharacterized protein BBA_00480 [Beauveria bassiana ARSEF 2860]EJP70850.1 hypothetical protein BBA_00480 [Beauveria bassiana ARSEF 2860]